MDYLLCTFLHLPYWCSQGSLVPQDRETKQEAYDNSVAFEGKEFLRKRVISQRVRVVVDYLRTDAPRGGKGQAQNAPAEKEFSNEKVYVSVYLDKKYVSLSVNSFSNLQSLAMSPLSS